MHPLLCTPLHGMDCACVFCNLRSQEPCELHINVYLSYRNTIFPTRETEGQRISNTPDEYIIQASFVKSINLLIFIDHQVCTKHWCEDREVTRISAVRELTLNWSLLNSKSQFLYSTCQCVLGLRCPLSL